MNISEKIISINSHGILSTQDFYMNEAFEPQENVQSFDESNRKVVALNAISSIAGITVSLFNPAKGGFSVAVEERIGNNGILQRSIQRTSQQIARKTEDFAQACPLLSEKTRQRAAISNVLSNDQEFRADVTRKAHHTALLILKNILARDDEKESLQGCRETTRGYVLPSNIDKILISSQFQYEIQELLQSIEGKIIFVPETTHTRDIVKSCGLSF